MAGGRPRIYESAQDFDDACESYFAECDQNGARPLITGLAYHLGFADKTTLYEYKDRPEFSYSCKRSIMRVEMWYEGNLNSNNVTGSIFALKNMGWKDKTEQELSGTLGIQQITGMEVK
jgi:hypothetical protein